MYLYELADVTGVDPAKGVPKLAWAKAKSFSIKENNSH